MGSFFTLVANAIASKLIDKIYDEMMRKKSDMEVVTPAVLAPVEYARDESGK